MRERECVPVGMVRVVYDGVIETMTPVWTWSDWVNRMQDEEEKSRTHHGPTHHGAIVAVAGE